MDDFDYSLSALSVLSLFHDSEFLVYVEGEDDIVYWKNILDLADIEGYYIQSVNGVENLAPKIKNIIDDGAKIIIARDKDYARFTDDNIEHPQIITTYGHSIENTMYCPIIINSIINSLSKTINDYTGLIDNWYEAFCTTCNNLLTYDIANIRYSKGVTVLGDNCCRFLTNDKSSKLSKTKIDQYITEIKANFNEEELQTCETMINAYPGKKRYLIKGHFITHAVANLVKLFVSKLGDKSVVLPSANLYALTINGCISCRQICDEIEDTILKVKQAFQAITA